MKSIARRILSILVCLAITAGLVLIPQVSSNVAIAATPGPEQLPRPGYTERDRVLEYYSNGAFGDTKLSFEERAADLISRMTRAEKIAVLQASTNNNGTGAVPTLGLLPYRWWNEALHGIARDGLATSFPSPLNMGATWNPDLMLKCATIMSDEGRVKSNTLYNRNGTALTYWSPTINLARDPRWGRNEESYGEDPFHTGVLASMFTRGLQGDPQYDELYTDKYLKAIATMKHYAANNTENTRNGGNMAMDDRSLREYYTANFQYIAEHADIEAVMSAYNKVNGVPAAANTYLLDDLLRKTWGFDGHVVSDCGAIGNVYGNGAGGAGYWSSLPTNSTNRRLAGIAWSIQAGTDISCGNEYVAGSNGVNASINAGYMTEDDLDLALLRLFATRFRSGEFDPIDEVPYRKLTNDDLGKASSNELALEAGCASLTLLKNAVPAGDSKKMLPINLDTVPDNGTILLVGNLADILELGDYSADSVPSSTTIRQGFQNYINNYNAAHPGRNLQFKFYHGYYNAPGASYTRISTHEDYETALAEAATADITIVYSGTGYQNTQYRQAVEGTDRPNLDLYAAEVTVATNVLAAAKKSVLVMCALGFYDVGSYINNADAFIWSSYNGQQQGAALAKVVFGDYNPSARLNFTWLKDITQYPATSVYNLRADDGSNGRTYQYFTGDVTWPFGFGLSYTDYKVDNVKIDKAAAGVKDKVVVTFDVENLGDMAGAQTVQVYVTAPMAYEADGITRNNAYPFKQLKGFAQVQLAAHEKKSASVELDVNEFFFFDSNATMNQVDNRTGRPNNTDGTGKRVVYSGDYKIHVATSAADADTVDTKTLAVSGTDAAAAKPWLKTVTLQGAKVWAAPGVDSKSKLSLAMSNERLYQTVTNNDLSAEAEMSALLADLTAAGINSEVVFSSSKAAVATVDQQGLVKAKTNGVTTITAKITIDGVTMEASYPFAVFGDRLQDTDNAYLTGISVNGKPLEGFSKEITEYEVLVPLGEAINVTYANGANMFNVSVQAPEKSPGKATLTVTNVENEAAENYAVVIYTITINIPPSTECDIVSVDAPLVMNGADIKSTVSIHTTGINLTNMISVSDNATWALYSNPAYTTAAEKNMGSLVAGDNIRYLRVTAQDGITTKDYVVTITRQTSIAGRFETAPLMNGTLDPAEWGDKVYTIAVGAEGTVIQQYNPSPGYPPESFNTDIYTAYDANNFYLGMIVTDPLWQAARAGSNLWQGCAFQVNLWSGRTGGRSEYGFGLTETGPAHWQWTTASGCTALPTGYNNYDIKRVGDSDTFIYTIAVPLNSFGRNAAENPLVEGNEVWFSISYNYPSASNMICALDMGFMAKDIGSGRPIILGSDIVIPGKAKIVDYTENLTAGYAANVFVEIDEPANGLTAEIKVNDVSYTAALNSDTSAIIAIPAIGTENLVLSLLDEGKVIDSKTIKVNVMPADIWTAKGSAVGDDVLVEFAAKVSPIAKGYSAKVNGSAAVVAAEGDSALKVLNAKPSDKIVISGIKFSDYFPSYSFTFTIN